jgi:hypothetical protein
MEIIGKPIKFGLFQVQRIIDNFGIEKIQLKYFHRTKVGITFNKFQVLYIKMQDWKELKKMIRKKGKE